MFAIPKTDKFYNAEGMTAFLQHGGFGLPMSTEQVAIKRADSTATPRTGPIPSNFKIKFDGRWLRVWVGSAEGPFVKTQYGRIKCTVNHLS